MRADSAVQQSDGMRSAAGPAAGRGRGGTIVRIAAVKKAFGEVEAIRQLSFDVADGEFLSLLGPSGCGKSTLLMMIAGLIDPTAGEIRIKDAKVAGPRREVGVVFQSPVLLPWRTVLQNVLFPIELLKLPRRQYEPRAMDLLRMAKIDEFSGLLPRQLSGGMRQRVAICRALVHDPSILLMDEPFSALDAMTRAILQELLLKIRQTIPVTILFVTHDVDEAVFLSDKITALGRAPASLREEVTVDLPYPRDQLKTRADSRFGEIQQRLFSNIFLQEKSLIAS
jgi:NitT/TauT family transport system ATP-binding protein